MKIERLRAKLAKYEEAYRAARREYGQALSLEITRMHASDLPEPAAKARRKKVGGPKAGPKAQSSGAVAVTTTKATVTHTASKRGPGRPRMTPAQKLAARAERQAKLMTMSELGSMAAMDDQISQYDADAKMSARHAQ